MTASISFDGLTLVNPEPPADIDMGLLAREIRLFSGKTYVKTSAETRFKGRFRGITANYSDITALLAKNNTSGTLIVDGESYTACKMTAFRYGWHTVTGSYYWYEVEFTQHTA